MDKSSNNKPIQPNEAKTNQPPQQNTNKPKLTKKQIILICSAIVALLVIAVATVLLLILNRPQPQTEDANDAETAETAQDEPTIDYDQKITDADGNEFKAEYQSGSEQNFAIRFADLKCEDNCKNINEVKLGDKILKQGEDYEVKSGSVIIVLYEDFMKSLKAGEFDLVIAIQDEDKTTLYGVKFTVKPEPTCTADETLEKGKCVQKPAEQSTGNQTNNTTTKPSNNQSTTQPTQPSQPATPSKSQAQITCENKVAPAGLSQVYWYSDADRQELGYEKDVVAGISVFNIDNSKVKMHWVDGVCRPSIAQAPEGSMTGVGLMPVTMEQLRTQPYPVYQAALQNQGRNMVVWYWSADQQNYTIEYLTNLGVIWGY